MVQLRETTKRKVVDALNRSHFTSAAFSVAFDDEATEFLRITFLPKEEFQFTANKTYGGYSTSEAPGQHVVTTEETERKTLDECLKAISPWVARILEDYRTHNPLVDEFETLRQTLTEQVARHINDESAHFSPEEMAAMRAKLDDLSSKLSEVSERTYEQERQLKEAQEEIKSLKADLEVFPKGVWYRMAGSKVVNILKKAAGSKEVRDFALEAAKKLLLPGPK